MISTKTSSELWTDEQFKSMRGIFNYRGVLITRNIGGWSVFDTNPKKAQTRLEVDEIINNAANSIKQSIKK